MLSCRWADMFTAKGCHDNPGHGFSHPFLQVVNTLDHTVLVLQNFFTNRYLLVNEVEV